MNNITIGARLTFGFTFLLLLAAILAATGLWLIDTTSHLDIPSADRHNGHLWLITLAVAGLSAGLILSITITRSILRPLHQALDLLYPTEPASGTNRRPERKQNEAIMLLHALQRVIPERSKVMSHTQHKASETTQAFQELTIENQELTQKNETQIQLLADARSLMERLGTAIHQNADRAQHANTLVLTATDVTTRGGDIVSQVIETMDSIDSSSTQVEDIIGVIDSIAFQTNILALNAAVESARAGEAGRGFAVVASEVRSLAQRSAQAAQEIKTLITASVTATARGNRLVSETGTTMTEIADAIQRVTDIMDEMSAASREQTADIEDINRALTQADEPATRQTASEPENTITAPRPSHAARTTTRPTPPTPLGRTITPVATARAPMLQGTFQTSAGTVEEWEEF